MKQVTRIKQISLIAISAFALTATIGGAVSAAPCLTPTPDCPLSNCG